MEHKTYNIDNIYQGKISSLLPSLNAAFIALHPTEKNGFLNFEDSKLLKKRKQFQNFSKNILSKSSVMVQIIREPRGNKGPSLSLNISLVGKYLTIFPGSKMTHTEKKLPNLKSKEYLRALRHLLIPLKSMGVLIKLGALKTNPNFLINEIKVLKFRWVIIIKKSKLFHIPCLLSKRKTLINKIFEKYFYLPFAFIAIDSHRGAIKIKKIISRIYNIKNIGKTRKITIQFHKNNSILIRHHLIDITISEIMKPRVNLNNGGYIIIEKTEALTSIDVNSGSFNNLINIDDPSSWINYSAVYEIMKQIRLRNLGGIIIIDFIDSNTQKNQIQLLQYMERLIRKDFVQCNIVQLSELGLVEITRSRQGQSVYDAFSRKCNLCNGLGYSPIHVEKNNLLNYELVVGLEPSFYNKMLAIRY
jgi:ribonuclease E